MPVSKKPRTRRPKREETWPPTTAEIQAALDMLVAQGRIRMRIIGGEPAYYHPDYEGQVSLTEEQMARVQAKGSA